MNLLKSLSELLNPNVAITKNDAYFYAQSICQKVDFSKGADDSTQKLHTEIENEVSIQDLTLPELYRLATIVKNVIEASQLQDDEFQITSWGSLI